jgi:hypothetical protein
MSIGLLQTVAQFDLKMQWRVQFPPQLLLRTSLETVASLALPAEVDQPPVPEHGFPLLGRRARGECAKDKLSRRFVLVCDKGHWKAGARCGNEGACVHRAPMRLRARKGLSQRAVPILIAS